MRVTATCDRPDDFDVVLRLDAKTARELAEVLSFNVSIPESLRATDHGDLAARFYEWCSPIRMAIDKALTRR